MKVAIYARYSSDNQRDDCGVVPEDAPDNGRLLVYDLALTGGDNAVLEATNDTIAVAQTATGLAVLDASAEPSARLVGELR